MHLVIDFFLLAVTLAFLVRHDDVESVIFSFEKKNHTFLKEIQGLRKQFYPKKIQDLRKFEKSGPSCIVKHK